MNDHDRTTPEAPAAPGSPPKLQALNIAALSGIGDALDAMVCDIDDPDCEAPSLGLPAVEGDRRRTEVIDGPPDDLDA